MPDLGLLGAFLGGALSLLSPCSALLLPAFFAYAFERTGTLLTRTAGFYIGAAVVLVPLGAGVGAVGALFTRYRETATVAAGMVLVVFGVMMVLGLGFSSGAARRAMDRISVGSGLSVLALGAVYGLAGFCSGPLLGAVLTVSAAGGSAIRGGVLMAAYALGMASPLFVLALGWDRFGLRNNRWLRGKPVTIGPIRTHTTSLLSGALFIVLGLAFILTRGTSSLGGLVGLDTQFKLEQWAVSTGDRRTDLLVALVIVLALLAMVLIYLVRSKKRLAP